MSPNNDDRIHVSFWGTRGSISTPGRITEKYGGNTPCVSLRCGNVIVILDAGTGIRNLGLDLTEEFKGREAGLSLHLFLSHTHWDHIQGLPFFQPAYLKEVRLAIHGSPRKERFLESVLMGQMDYEYFPVSMSAFAADITIHEISEEVLQLGSLRIGWQEQIYHPGGSVRYRFDTEGKRVVYATDVELDRIFGEKADVEGGGPAGEYMDFIDGADLLIADGQYTEEEYPGKMGWGHSSIPVLIEAALHAGVKQLAIFHHDPQHSDKFLDDQWTRYRSVGSSGKHAMDLFWAREGMTLAV
ncbi:MAG: MBL fold metallo-hydrolase [Deltaproteobacteria bacterium]|nr:MBL fold metallo-hydrolase [Deltaproteobacteria bacterium]